MATTAEKKVKETAALVALTENGLSRTEAGRILGMSKERVDRALDDARLELVARAQEYVDLHLEAARNAAAKGKSAPMKWALERMGVVKPPEAAQSGAKTGPTIKIGIMLPGLAGASNQPAIDARVEEE